jgi:hypothetical protein
VFVFVFSHGGEAGAAVAAQTLLSSRLSRPCSTRLGGLVRGIGLRKGFFKSGATFVMAGEGDLLADLKELGRRRDAEEYAGELCELVSTQEEREEVERVLSELNSAAVAWDMANDMFPGPEMAIEADKALEKISSGVARIKELTGCTLIHHGMAFQLERPQPVVKAATKS